MKYELHCGSGATVIFDFLPTLLGTNYAVRTQICCSATEKCASAFGASLVIRCFGRAFHAMVDNAPIVHLGHIGSGIPFFGPAIDAFQQLARSVPSIVFWSRKYLKVLDSVIGLISVYVMNYFMRFQWATKMMLHDNLMFSSAPIFAPNFRGQNYIAAANGCASFEDCVVFSNSLGLLQPILVPWEKVHWLTFDMSVNAVIVAGYTGFLSASATTVAIRDFVKRELGLGKLWGIIHCVISSLTASGRAGTLQRRRLFLLVRTPLSIAQVGGFHQWFEQEKEVLNGV